MLQRTFLHLPGIGETTERRMWESGVRSWSDFAAAHECGGLCGKRTEGIANGVFESMRRYESGDWRFFDAHLPSPHKWRAFDDLGDRILYVDIETTGMGSDAEITVIGTYDGRTAKSFVAGGNLRDAVAEIEAHPLIATYNGAQFDLPVIRRQFPRNVFNHIHIDLRFPLRRLGYSGGLKKVEEAFGIQRSPRTKGLDGWDAVRLWHEYQRGRVAALDLLLEYNIEDIRNLEPLMTFVHREMSRSVQGPTGRGDIRRSPTFP
jgi:uncharacterized protein